MLSPVRCCVIDSSFSPFFCDSKVTVTESAAASSGSVCGSSRRREKNRTLPMMMIFVFRGPGTVQYSHERQAKKKAAISSSTIALSSIQCDAVSSTEYGPGDCLLRSGGRVEVSVAPELAV